LEIKKFTLYPFARRNWTAVVGGQRGLRCGRFYLKPSEAREVFVLLSFFVVFIAKEERRKKMGAGASTHGNHLQQVVDKEAVKPLDATDVQTPRGETAVEEVKRLRKVIKDAQEESLEMKKALFGNAPSLQEFFKYIFEKWDRDGNGTLTTEEFWSMMDGLNLNLKPREIQVLQAKTDSDQNGTISLAEFIEAAPKYLQELSQEKEEKSAEDWMQLEDSEGNVFYYNKRTSESQWDAPPVFIAAANKAADEQELKMSPDLRDYLTDIFQASDSDGSGNLDKEEFSQLCQTNLNLGLSEEKFEQLMAKADINADGIIKWQEFVLVAPDLIKQLQADVPDEEAWIKQVDANGNAYWLNTKTGESKWAEELEEPNEDKEQGESTQEENVEA